MNEGYQGVNSMGQPPSLRMHCQIDLASSLLPFLARNEPSIYGHVPLVAALRPIAVIAVIAVSRPHWP